MFNQNRAGGAFGLGGNTQAGNTGFGATPTFGAGGGLGQPTGMPSFGQAGGNTFGQPSMGQSPGFGTTPGTQSVFGGGGTTTSFGQATPTGFGQQGGGLGAARPSTGFGNTGSVGFGMGATPTGGLGGMGNTGGFGATSTPGGFGTSTSGAFGQPTPGLGGAPSTTGGLFGAGAQGTGFGAQKTPTMGFGGATGGFGMGAQTPGSTAFGGTPNTGFGATQPTPGFGQATPSTTFGANPTTFGGTPNQSAGFGGGASAWGAGGMGTRAGQPGTGNPPYKPTSSNDASGNALIESITAMDPYKDKSFEELRWEDYQRGNNKGGSGTTIQTIGVQGFGGMGTQQPQMGGGGFGNTSAGSTWGQPANKFGMAAPTTTTTLGGFGASTGGFGSAAPKPGGFGATPTPSFGTPSAGTSLFGQPQQQQAGTTGFGGLGQQQQQQTPGLGGGGFGGFGTPGTGTLGTPGQAPSLFGQAPAPAPSGFGGAGGFGSTTSPSTGFGGFGASTTANKPATPGFGGFGAAAPATSSFGTPSGGLGSAKPGGFGAAGFGTPGTTNNAWGSTTPGLGGGFGGAQTTSAFSGGFGSKPATTTPTLGTLGGAGGFGGGFGGSSFAQPSTGGFGGLGGATAGFGAAPSSLAPQQSSTSFLGMPTTNMQSTLFQQQQQQHQQNATPGSSFLGGGGLASAGGFGTPAPSDQANMLLLSSSGKKGMTRSRSDSTDAATPPALQSYRYTPKSAAKLYPRGMQRALEASGGSSSADVNIVSPITDSFTSRSVKTLNLDDFGPGSDFMPSAPPALTGTPSSAMESKYDPLSDDAARRRSGNLMLPSSPSRDKPLTPSRQLTDGGVSESKGPASPPRSGRVVRPKLTKPGYSTSPPMEQLATMEEASLRAVHEFTVQNAHGKVTWDGTTDLRGLDLDRIVDIKKKVVAVYPEDEDGGHADDSLKPPQGHGLNKPARITLFKVVSNKKSPEQYKEELRALVQRWDGASFEDYNLQTGAWTFRVAHFSKYGAPDDDDDDEDGASQPPPQTRASVKATQRVTRSTSATGGGGGSSRKRGGYGLQDSDEEELDQSGTPMEEGTGEAGGSPTMVDDRQAELDSEFDSLLNQDDEAGEGEVMVVAEEGPAYQPPKNPKDLSDIFGVASEDVAGPLADDSGVPYAPVQPLSGASNRRNRSSYLRGLQTRANRRLDQTPGGRLYRDETDMDESDADEDHAPLGPPAPLPPTPPATRRSTFTSLQLGVVEHALKTSSAKKAARPRASTDLVPVDSRPPPVGDFPLARAIPPFLVPTIEESRVDGAQLTGLAGSRRKPLDYSHFMGRSFRAGWGPDGTLIMPMGNRVVKQRLSSAITRDAGHEYLEAPLRIHHAASGRPSPPDSRRLLANGPDKHTAPHWTLPPVVTPTEAEPNARNYCAVVECIWKFIDLAKAHTPSDTAIGGRARVVQQTWELVNALWGQEGLVEARRPLPLHGALRQLNEMLNSHWRTTRGGGAEPNWTDLERRKQAVSVWLKNTINRARPLAPGTMAEEEKVLLKLLYRNRVDEAAERAMSLGLVRLATLIPMAGEDPARDYLKEQVDAWEHDRSTVNMQPEVLLVYRLLSGVDSEDLHEEATTWYQSLGLYLWYLRLDKEAQQGDAGEVDDQLFQSLQTFYTRKPSKPVPWYIEDRAFVNELPEELLEDKVSVISSLLSLYIDEKYPPERLLEPLGLMVDQLDYLTPWLLMSILHALGLGEAFNANIGRQQLRTWPQVTWSLIFQLTSFGRWTWAVYVATHLEDETSRATIIKDLIGRFAFRASDEEIKWLCELGVPNDWILASRAVFLRSKGRLYVGPKPRTEAPLGLLDAMTTCRDCGDWDMLHDLAMNIAAPRLILEDKEATLLSLLQELEKHSGGIREWEQHGKLCLQYLRVVLEKVIPLWKRLGENTQGAHFEVDIQTCVRELTSVYKSLEGEANCLSWSSHVLGVTEGGPPLRQERKKKHMSSVMRKTLEVPQDEAQQVQAGRDKAGRTTQPAILHAARSNVMSNVVRKLHVLMDTLGNLGYVVPERDREFAENINDQVFHDFRLQQLEYAVDAHIRLLDG